jgi:hypothetical protein
MENFNLSTRYDAIFIASGSFQLLVTAEDALTSLQCIRRSLSDQGFFVLDIFVPWGEIISQKCDSIQVTRDVSRTDGTRSIVHERYKVCIPEQIKLGTYRYEFYDQKQLAQCIIDDLSIRWYWKDEFVSLLKSAHFSTTEILTHSSLYDEGNNLYSRHPSSWEFRRPRRPGWLTLAADRVFAPGPSVHPQKKENYGSL